MSDYIVIIIGQNLLCLIQLQSFLVPLDLSDGIFKAKMKSNGDKPSLCFRVF